MFKFVGLLVICGILNSDVVSGQNAASTAVSNTIGSYQVGFLSTLTNPFNTLRDDMYGHFYRSQNIIDDVESTLFSNGQRLPYFTMSHSARDDLSKGITDFMKDCTRPTIEFLHDKAILPLFDFTTGNNTTPAEAAGRPITDNLDRIQDAALQATNETCLNSVGVNSARLRSLFNAAVSQINGCLTSTFNTLRPPVNAFIAMHFAALRQINVLTNSVQSCSSIFVSNRTACAINATPGLCSVSTEARNCTTCASIQNLKNQSISMVSQAKELLNTCFAKTADTINSTNVDSLITSIKACSTAVPAADQPAAEENDVIVEEQNRSENVDVEGEEEKGSPKSMPEFVVDYDYISVY